ncbi:tetratricopeptide repeat-containing sensor histidine kinase [Psychroserpens algicola]|uniref:histidine kinase n=1 Tax=Psychroserpens algicola TaxID=1719034 RepID=A0ABT0HAE1_9FLAO|nr:tetratricopeptide repeat protein [Psychroserpens algicola]MCK8481349.1 tetratricopeptide repeat protein [Psychroserpens algicola]
MKKSQCFFLFILICSSGYSQNLDSLLTVARQTKNDSVKIRMFNKIAFSYIFNDTNKALKVIKEGKTLANEAQFHFGLTELTNTHGIYMDITGKSDSAGYYFEKALDMSRTHDFQIIESMCINNLGMYNWNRANYDKALDYFFQSLKMNEAIDDERSTASSLNNIGLIYQEMNLSEKALSYHKKALSVREKYNLENEQIASLNNIGINLKDLGRVDEAIITYKKGIALAKRKNNLIDYYKLLDNLANAYNVNGDLDLALQTYLKALDKPEGYESEQKAQLATLNNIAALYNELNQPKTALRYAEKGFELVKKYPEIELISADLNLTTAESYYMLNDFKKARAKRQEFITLKDSIFSETNAVAIADLEIKYETEKKEREILVQRAELAENKLTIQQRDYQIYGLIALALILGLIGFLFFNQQKLKNKQLQKENELKDALIKIETQNRLQEQRLRISRDLHDNIGAQLTFIISSIDNLKYGFDIKDEKLTKKLETISQFASTTIYELRDTIWAMNKNEISLEDLQSRISNFIEKADTASDGVQFKFNSSTSKMEQVTFTSVEGMNMYRIIQEGINNALKYADAKNITVDFSVEQGDFVFKVSDDGKGFDVKNATLGNGINNMKKRAQDIGGFLTLLSDDNGTVLLLKLKKHI